MTLAACLCAETPEERALAYLSREVPRWFTENRCFSCHNNGDGARALFRAIALKQRVSRSAIDSSVQWLAKPASWDSNRGDPAISDKKLARIQFATSLLDAVDAGLAPESALADAARIVAGEQDPDGAWRCVGAEAGLGSPVTYGLALATFMAKRVVDRGGEVESARKASVWFAKFDPKSNMDLAATILGAPGRRRELAAKLRATQNPDGGWGPYRATPSEVFDTALAILALGRDESRGRQFLIRSQLTEGGWAETTRPPGARSYAQHISTSGWATLALIETSAR
jgi:hypothetical protein